MANSKSMTVSAAILTFYALKWSKCRIARHLGVHRETVARHIRLAAAAEAQAAGCESKPSIPPTGSEGAKPSIPPAGSPDAEAGRRSQCEPLRESIDAKLRDGLSAQRIFQDLRTDDGFEGSYDAVKRFVRRLKASEPERIYRLECLPGEEAQVDFGSGYYLEEQGKRRKVNVLRVVLSCSRKAYTEAVLHQTSEAFIRCLENAFRAFGGVVQSVVIDNLRAAVTKADWYEPELCPKIESFTRHYGTVILPCHARTPEHKGKVENAVKYLKNNALKGRVFDSLQALNAHLRNWEEAVADTRIHGTTRQQVRDRFLSLERPALQPLPPDLFPCFEEGQRMVHRDSHVEVAGAYYEVPEEYISQQVWVRWDGRLVRVFNRRFEQIAVLARQRRGQFTRPLGARGCSSAGVERDKAFWLKRCARVGEHCGVWALEVIASHGGPGIRLLQGLVHMARKYSCRELDRACEMALSHGAYRLRDLRRLMAHPSQQQTLPFMQNHPLIRDMREYTAFLEMLYPDDETQPMQEMQP
ncbi:MAG: IS21 family transposase [Armatimonadia bacterium]